MESYSDGSEEQNIEKWYIDRVLEGVTHRDGSEVMEALFHAWASGDMITVSMLRIRDPENPEREKTLSEVLSKFFSDLIRQKRLSVEERIKMYKLFLDKDPDMAPVFIERIYSEFENEKYDEFEDKLINPEELYEVQMNHYIWYIDNMRDSAGLAGLLDMDGHMDGSAPYPLRSEVKKKIIDFAIEIMRKTESETDSISYLSAEKILAALEGPDYQNELDI